MDSEAKNTSHCMVWCLVGVLLGFVAPLFLIFGFDSEARSDWPRMIPAAVMGPIIWMMAMFGLGLGSFELFKSIKDKTFFEELPGLCAMIFPGLFVPYYWIKRIVFDDVPAFGYNPDNIYAVAGLNSFVFGIGLVLAGLLVGSAISGLYKKFHRD